jgi:hypothetical protein
MLHRQLLLHSPSDPGTRDCYHLGFLQARMYSAYIHQPHSHGVLLFSNCSAVFHILNRAMLFLAGMCRAHGIPHQRETPPNTLAPALATAWVINRHIYWPSAHIHQPHMCSFLLLLTSSMCYVGRHVPCARHPTPARDITKRPSPRTCYRLGHQQAQHC